MEDRPTGYTARTIYTAINRVYRGRNLTTKMINEYARANNLANEIEVRGGTRLLIIPEAKLEELIQGMEIPVNINDLMEEIQKIPSSLTH